MQTTLLETFLLSVFECVRHQKAKKQRNHRISGCKTTLWKMCLSCVFEFLMKKNAKMHSKHFLWRNKIIYTKKQVFWMFWACYEENAKMYRIRGSERILWVTCIICVLSFVDFTLLGSKNQKCKQNNLWKKTTYQEICLLSVYERVRHKNEKKKSWKSPYMGIQNNITKTCLLSVFEFIKHKIASKTLFMERKNNIIQEKYFDCFSACYVEKNGKM